MWKTLDTKTRLELMDNYKKGYPNFSYRDMVNHFNDTNKHQDGGQLPTNGLTVHQGRPDEQDLDKSPLWWKGSKYPYRIQDPNKRDQVIKDYLYNLRDSGQDPYNSFQNLRINNQSYGSDRFSDNKIPNRSDYFENYHGFDYNDIDENKVNKWNSEYNDLMNR